MNRRALLRAVGLAGVSLAGCVAPSGSDADVSSPSEASGSPSSTEAASSTPTPSRTPSPVTPAPDDPIAVRLDNGGPPETVDISVTDGETTLLDETVELATDDSETFDSGIDATGEYTLTVDVRDGPERSYGLDIESYDLRMGSNAIVRIGHPDLPEEIFIIVEE